MNVEQQTLARKHLDKRLAPLQNVELAVPPRGWMKALREALGMSTRQLAARMGVSPSRIPTIEKAEVTGATTIRTLREAAGVGIIDSFHVPFPLGLSSRVNPCPSARLGVEGASRRCRRGITRPARKAQLAGRPGIPAAARRLGLVPRQGQSPLALRLAIGIVTRQGRDRRAQLGSSGRKPRARRHSRIA